MQRVFPWTQIERDTPRWRERRLTKALIIAGLALSLTGTLALFRPWFYFAINSTNSLGGFLYLVLPGRQPVVGEKMAFYPPHNRFYPDGAWFVKIVRGAEGDRVEIREHQVFLNGEYLGWVLDQAGNGDPLEPMDNTVIPKDHYFVWTPHGRSYDSRYRDIGLVHKDAFIGSAIRLL